MTISPQLLWQSLINGFALGWIYVLMALGLSLIFGVTKIMQFAQGEIYMLGAYTVAVFAVTLKLNLYFSIAIGMVAMGLFGLILYRFLFHRVQGQILNPVVISVGLTLVLQSAVVVRFGITERTMPRLAQGHFTLFGAVVPKDRVVAIVISMLLFAALYAFLKRNKYGQGMIASAQSPEGALLQGISPFAMGAVSMIAGCALSAAAGAMAGSIFQLTPYMGTQPLTKGLVIIVLGGMGSIPGAVVGGLFLGLVDGLVPPTLGAGPAAILPLVLVIIVLLLRPGGLWGHEE